MSRRFAILLLALLLVAGILCFPLPYLAVEDAHGQLVWLPFLGSERRFSIKYRHSVEKTLCWEDFIVGENGDLVLVATRYESLGVGLPFIVGEGQLVNKEGQFHLTGLNRHFPHLVLRTVPVAEQALVVRGRTYRFDDSFAPGAMIKLKAKNLSLLQLLSYKLSKGE